MNTTELHAWFAKFSMAFSDKLLELDAIVRQRFVFFRTEVEKQGEEAAPQDYLRKHDLDNSVQAIATLDPKFLEAMNLFGENKDFSVLALEEFALRIQAFKDSMQEEMHAIQKNSEVRKEFSRGRKFAQALGGIEAFSQFHILSAEGLIYQMDAFTNEREPLRWPITPIVKEFRKCAPNFMTAYFDINIDALKKLNPSFQYRTARVLIACGLAMYTLMDSFASKYSPDFFLENSLCKNIKGKLEALKELLG